MHGVPDEVAHRFAPLLGEVAWQVRHGHGSFLTFDFGLPLLTSVPQTLRATTPQDRHVGVTGTWHLWIYCCAWEAFHRGHMLAWSESPDDAIGGLVQRLQGRALRRVHMAPVDTGQVLTVFVFEGDVELMTVPWERDDAEELNDQWMLFHPEGVLTVREDWRVTDRPDGA